MTDKASPLVRLCAKKKISPPHQTHTSFYRNLPCGLSLQVYAQHHRPEVFLLAFPFVCMRLYTSNYCAVQCLLRSLDICFIELFCCQATKIKLVTAKVWPKGGPKNGSVLRPQKWPRKNKYIISAYDSGRAHFWGHETAPKVAPLFCPRSFAERC